MDDVTVINRALSRIGCLPIQSKAAPGPAGMGVVYTYDGILEDILSKYPWHFTKRFAALTRMTEKPTIGWSTAFLLPQGRLSLPRAYYESANSDRPLLRYQISRNQVWTNTSNLFAEYQVKPYPDEWPGYFTELIVLCCMAEYALEVREDETMRQRLRRDAYGPPDYQGEGGQFKIATDLDAQAMPSQQPAGGANPLTDIRESWEDPEDARYGW